MKVASARESAHLRGSSAKLAATSKWAEIRKEILPNSGQPTVGMMSNCEPDIPKSRLLQGNLADLLTTLAGLGIILKPHEFQQASLHRMGMGRYSDELDRRGLVFRPRRSETHVDLPPDRFRPRLASLLADLLEDRSGLVPYLPRRVMRVTIIRASPPPARRWADSEPLLKVAHAYDAYRTSLKELPQLLDVAVSEHPGYYAKHFFSELLTDSMEKMASSAFGASLPDCTVPLYVYSAYRNSAPEAPPSWEMPLPRHSPARALIAPTL